MIYICNNSVIITILEYSYNMEEFKCPLCKNLYTQTNPPRLLTMCGHTFCHHCIKTIIIKRKDYRYMVRCPDDRLTVNVQTNSPSHFPKNIAILQAISRLVKVKDESHETNQFLIDKNASVKKITNMSETRNSLVELKQSFLGYRRMSIEEGICLLHRKQLDIVCIEEKIYICAECALFGLHKGHNFTTHKQITQKNRQWSHKITEIIEQKNHIDAKIINGEIQKEISSILHKKKDLLNDEIDYYIKTIKEKIDYHQKKLKQELEEKIKQLQVDLRQVMLINPTFEQQFQKWSKKAYQKCLQLQQMSNDSMNIIIVDKSDQDMLLKGTVLLQDMKNELIQYWSKVESLLQYPKLAYSQQIEKSLYSLIKFNQQKSQTKNEELLSMQATKLEDQSLLQIKNDIPMLDEVSLLDLSGGIKYEQIETSHMNLSQIYFANEAFGLKSAQNLGKSQIFPERRMNRLKSRELNLNTSLINNSNKKIEYKSPKQKVKTQIFSRKNILLPTSPKGKLRRLVLKVKQPQKFQKILSSLQADNIDSIDVTGYQMGDQVAKELCLIIQDCKKPKMLRLMKNNLTDQCLKQVIETLNVIDYLNLAQNLFTEKVFDILLQLTRTGISKGKTIQLGQNRLNSRKYKDKIDLLKKVGIIITL